MTIKLSKNHLLYTAALVFAVAAVGCVSEEETPTEPVRDASFLGYSNPDTKQTTCGNCHTDIQQEWAGTKHASAWADLQASGHAQDMCYRCHTVNGRTNGSADTTLGFFAVAENAQPLYRDVQCESCHGAGSTHVSAPGESQPLPTMLVPTSYQDGCTACHNGTHHPFAEQLAASRHGQQPNWEGGSATSTNSCQLNCHNGYQAIGIFATRAPFRDGRMTGAVSDPAVSHFCSTCHQPHEGGADNPAQLRFRGLEAESAADSSTHVCGKCHSRGAVPTAWTSSRGAHSAQFASLMGTAGWRPASFGNITGPARHGTQEGSCATCHMASGAVNNAAGAFAVQNVGHTWKVIPCLNADSVATGGVVMANNCAEAQRDFSACATSNCHGSAESAMHAMELTQEEIHEYVNLLWVDTDGDDAIDAAPTDTGWLPKLLQHDATRAAGTKRFGTTGADAVETVAKGARFNALTFGHPIGHGDGSWGVHNPGYIRAIMANTVNLVRATYATTDTLVGVSPQMQARIERDIRRAQH